MSLTSEIKNENESSRAIYLKFRFGLSKNGFAQVSLIYSNLSNWKLEPGPFKEKKIKFEFDMFNSIIISFTIFFNFIDLKSNKHFNTKW